MLIPGEEKIDYLKVIEILQNEIEACGFQKNNIIGITRDNASYMSKAIRELKNIDRYQHFVDVTCISHGLNLVIKALLGPFTGQLDEVFPLLKALFKKPSQLRARANLEIPGFSSSIQVNPTRWSGAFDSISFVYGNYSKIIEFLQKEIGATSKLQTKIRLQKLEENLQKWGVVLTMKVRKFYCCLF